MTVYSMTGYASASAPAAGAAQNADSSTEAARVIVDVRAVNGRFLDLSLRLPDEVRALEGLLREAVTAQCRRGKIELRVQIQREDSGAWPRPQPEQLAALSALQAQVHTALPQAAPLSVQDALHWCRSHGTPSRADEAVMAAAREALAGLQEARAREGQRLVGILMERVHLLRQLASQAAPLVPQVVQKQQQRFMTRWQEALATVGTQAPMSTQALQERALSEAAAYALRLDVAEELERLGSHLDEIERLLQQGGDLGKRLDFLIQELHREANTLGSKSAALELTRVSVDMKVAIEQMREQVQNME